MENAVEKINTNDKIALTQNSSENIKNLIYTIRGKQVMLDSDVAMLYHYETKRVNEAVKRNMGIAYVIKEAVKNELAKKELYEVEMPIELPSLKLNLIYLKGELTKVDKKFIKEYLKNI